MNRYDNQKWLSYSSLMTVFSLKHTFTVLLLLLLVIQAKAQVITLVGDSEHPPYSWTENGAPAGIYFDIVNDFRQQYSKYRIDIQLMPWARALRMVRNGQADGIFPPHYFPEKRPYLIHYSQPIMDEISTVFCNASGMSKLQPDKKWPDNLTNADFVLSNAVLMGGDTFWKMSDEGTISTVRVTGVENALKMILLNRAECHINDEFTVYWQLLRMKERLPHYRKSIPEKVLTIDHEAGYLALGERLSTQTAKTLLDDFNSFLKQIDIREYQQRYR